MFLILTSFCYHRIRNRAPHELAENILWRLERSIILMYLYMLCMHTLLATGNIYNTLNLQIDYHCNNLCYAMQRKVNSRRRQCAAHEQVNNQVCQRSWTFVLCAIRTKQKNVMRNKLLTFRILSVSPLLWPSIDQSFLTFLWWLLHWVDGLLRDYALKKTTTVGLFLFPQMPGKKTEKIYICFYIHRNKIIEHNDCRRTSCKSLQ